MKNNANNKNNRRNKKRGDAPSNKRWEHDSTQSEVKALKALLGKPAKPKGHDPDQ